MLCRISLLVVLCFPSLGAVRTLAQFVHRAWTAKDGAPANIKAITQTNDGYLWLASTQGLFRFDGVEFERFEPSGHPFPSTPVYSLFYCPHGDLWIGSAQSGISRLRGGSNRNYGAADGLPEGAVLGITEDHQGTVWAATQGGLARFDGTFWQKVGPESGFEGSPVSVFVDRQGTLWVADIVRIFSLQQGSTRFQGSEFRVIYPMKMLESPNGTVWMAETGRAVRPMPPAAGPEIVIGSQSILFDHDGGLWIPTLGDGLRRVAYPDRLPHEKLGKSSDQIESFTVKEGLSDDYVVSSYQDREGNIWVGTSVGLDRFTKGAVAPSGLPGKFTQSVIAPGERGDVWVGCLSGEMGRVHENQWYPELTGLALFSVAAAPDGSIWWAATSFLLHETAGHFVRFSSVKAYWNNHQPVRIAIDGSGALWLSGQSGVFVRRNDEWTSVDVPKGFPGQISTLAYADPIGRVWLGYKENAILIYEGRDLRILSSQNGLSVGAVLAIFVHGDMAWIGGSKGLQLFDGQRFRQIAPSDGINFGSVSGVLETADGSLWLNADRGIVRIASSAVAKLKAGASRADFTSFDSYDGLPGATQQSQPYPTLIQAKDGRLWFGTSGGPAWVDPNDIPRNELPPPVAIRSVTAKGKQYAFLAGLRLPALTRDLELRYTALSLTIPERVRFRYKLEGSDREWQDAGTRRQAFYTNLGPGRYRFRVMASNNDGVWNEVGAAADFGIEAAFYQTVWFRSLCYAAGLALLCLLYRYRLQQATAQVHSRLEGRIAERERIARELHDTILQSFQGLMLRLQVVDDLLPTGEAKEQLEQSLERADQAIAEGRRAVYNLRSSPTTGLEEALQSAAAQFAGDGCPTFRLVVEGTPRDLHPILRDEVYRIACEGLGNAFKHAHAAHVEAEITYGERALRLRVRDDGDGIPPDLLKSGRTGHYGLRGMRERAQQNGGRLEIWSSLKAGTEIDLSIPASIAYSRPSKRSVWRWFSRKDANS